MSASYAIGIYPSAHGVTQPDPTSPPDLTQPSSKNINTGTTQDDSTMNGAGSLSDLGSNGNSEQRHAGHTGYGPQYNQAMGFGDKIACLKEELEGKITNNLDLVEQGHQRRTGELKEYKQPEDGDDPFATPGEKIGKVRGTCD